jgi:hypothetical protein
MARRLEESSQLAVNMTAMPSSPIPLESIVSYPSVFLLTKERHSIAQVLATKGGTAEKS